MSNNVNMSFLLEVKLKRNFTNKVKNDNRFKNSSKALNKLFLNFINDENLTIVKKTDKKIFGFNIDNNTRSKINYYGNNTKEFINSTHLIKKIIEKYIEENR